MSAPGNRASFRKKLLSAAIARQRWLFQESGVLLKEFLILVVFVSIANCVLRDRRGLRIQCTRMTVPHRLSVSAI
jgi:hypothetical protein